LDLKSNTGLNSHYFDYDAWRWRWCSCLDTFKLSLYVVESSQKVFPRFLINTQQNTKTNKKKTWFEKWENVYKNFYSLVNLLSFCIIDKTISYEIRNKLTDFFDNRSNHKIEKTHLIEMDLKSFSRQVDWVNYCTTEGCRIHK